MPKYYKRKEDFEIIPIQDVKTMMLAAKTMKQWPRIWAILSITWITGARIGEVLKLKKENFRIEDDTLFITFHTLKGGSMREIKLSIKEIPFVKEVILPYINKKQGNLFSIGVRRAEQLLLEINKKTNMWYTFHEFRHSRITFLARNLRASTSELMDWTGWKSPAQVGTYLIREASERFKDKIK